MRVLGVLSLVMAILAGGVAAQDGATAPANDVRLFMTFVPNVQFAPVYAAEAIGAFSDHGLVVTIEHGDEPVGMDLIASGEREFGLISGEQVLAARANGRPVVSVYEWFQQYPIGVVYPTDAGISQVSDLTGRNVGIPGRFGASYSGLTALLSASGMTEQDIDLEEIGFNAPEVFCVGGVEASVVYINNEPLQIARQAEAGDCGSVTGVSVFRVADTVDMVSNGLVTSEALLADDPDLVQRMVTAFDAGLRYVIENPAAAYLLSAETVEGLPLSDGLRVALEQVAAERTASLTDGATTSIEDRRDYRTALSDTLHAAFTPEELVQFDVLMATIALWDAERLGLADAASWAKTQDVLLGMDYIASATDPTAAFTNDFLPE